MTTDRRRSDEGATLTEAAFAIPILFLFVFALLDLGLLVFQSSQAASVAREGARVGILDYRAADQATSADRDKIVTAVNRRLAGQPVESVTVRCLAPDDTAVSCADAVDGTDRIWVQVQWRRPFLTFVGPALGLGPRRTITGASSMVLVGRPRPASTP